MSHIMSLYKFFHKVFNSCLFNFLFSATLSMELSGCTSKFCQKVEMFGKKITYVSGDEYQDKKLNATPTTENSVPTIFNCLKNCSFEISCFSINYQQMTTTCQLLQENVYANGSLMVNSSDWTHVSVFVRNLCEFLFILVY